MSFPEVGEISHLQPLARRETGPPSGPAIFFFRVVSENEGRADGIYIYSCEDMEIIMIWSKITMLTIHEFHGSTAPVAWLNHGKNPHFDGSNLSKIDG